MGRVSSLSAILLGLTAMPACASELSLGVYEHDIDDTFSFGHTEHGKQIVVGARTAALDELAFIWRPRAHVIAGFNTAGGTDYLAAGLSWRFNFGGDRFYFEPGIGAAIHNGSVDLPSPYEPGLTPAEQAKRLYNWTHKLDLGSRVLFEPEWSLGWRATDRLSIEISWIHLSHAQLAGKQNPGLGDFGLRAVYRFGLDRGRPEPRMATDYPKPPRDRLPVNPADTQYAAVDASAQGRQPVNRSDSAAPSVASPPEGRLPVNPPDQLVTQQIAPPGPPEERLPPVVLRASPPPAVVKSSSSARKGDAVQIAATSTPDGAERALDEIKVEMAAWPSPPGGRIEKAIVHGSVVYRALVDGFEDTQAAQAFCANLRAAGRACFVRGG